MKIKILLADDHAVLRESLQHILSEEEGIEVLAEAENGREAVQIALESDIDIILMDINMPELNGIDAAKQILRDKPAVKIIILSMYSDHPYVDSALKAGVTGYILKNSAITEVVTAIRAVSHGRLYLSPEITGILVDDYIHYSSSEEMISTSPLSLREREVLQLLAEGKTTKVIAGLLSISEKTAEVHRKKIMEKLNLHSIAELTKYAIREGITSLDS